MVTRHTSPQTPEAEAVTMAINLAEEPQPSRPPQSQNNQLSTNTIHHLRFHNREVVRPLDVIFSPIIVLMDGMCISLYLAFLPIIFVFLYHKRHLALRGTGYSPDHSSTKEKQ